LLFGDTGCGKSFLINNLSRITNFPLVRTNMTGISATGFVGGSFEDVFQKLIDHNGDDLTDEDITEMMHRGEFYDLPLKKNSEYAIVHVDEIDKISENENSDKDGYSKDLQNELIGYVEDSDVLNGLINTKNMLFIGTGAFVGLEKIVLERMNRKTSIGFGSPVKKIETNVSKSDILSRVRPEDLVRYGFKPELVGRFPIMINIDTLNSNDLASILDLKTSFLSKKRRILRKAYDINLRFTKGAKNFIGEYAQKTGTNARALQLAIDNVLGDVEFDAESYRGKTIYFTKNGVKGILENSNLN
jgi:ATP-dependent Clp protease ATP-binding subunit ClpX